MDRELTMEEKGQVAYCLAEGFLMSDFTDEMRDDKISIDLEIVEFSDDLWATILNDLQEIKVGNSEVGGFLENLTKISRSEIFLFSEKLCKGALRALVADVEDQKLFEGQLSDEKTHGIALGLMVIDMMRMFSVTLDDDVEDMLVESEDYRDGDATLPEEIDDLAGVFCEYLEKGDLLESISEEKVLAFFRESFEKVYLLIFSDGQEIH